MDKKVTESGAKAHQRDDEEWRVKPYSLWHRKLDKSLYMLDVDFVEWRYRKGIPVAVGVMEVTRVDNGITVNDQYLDAIIRRFESRDFQATATRIVAESLKTKAYIILFREDCSEFWVYNLSERNGWVGYNPDEMEDFLKSL
ncbi:MAG TPA: hypothetical protein VMC84_12900 [Methanocella sp.]|nr:hypothetical protein [Methanocella sp.]